MHYPTLRWAFRTIRLSGLLSAAAAYRPFWCQDGARRPRGLWGLGLSFSDRAHGLGLEDLVTWQSSPSATLGGMVRSPRVAPRVPKEVDLHRKVCCHLSVTRLPRLMPMRLSTVDRRLDLLGTHGFQPQLDTYGHQHCLPSSRLPTVTASIPNNCSRRWAASCYRNSLGFATSSFGMISGP